MNEEIRKEILTRDIIRKELKYVFKYSFIELLLGVLSFTAVVAISLVLVLQHGLIGYLNSLSTTAVVLVIFSIAFIAAQIIALLVAACCGLYKYFVVLKSVKQNNFEVCIDKITDTQRLISSHRLNKVINEEVRSVYKRPAIHIFPELESQLSNKQYFYKLSFEKHKKYFLPNGRLYNWSQLNAMDEWQVFRSTKIGDEFYTVVINNKIIYVYNTKHFELQE